MKFGAMALLGAVVMLAGCKDPADQIRFDGKYFPTKVSKVDGQRDQIVVTVKEVAQSPEGALSAGRYAAVAYCVGLYGNSDIDWVVGPDTDPSQIRIQGNTMTFRGTCPQ
ncbi:hypothetical protein [Sulfitobacter sp. JB4-11]|uniref:hypothetical protein n=1 Tax=Sulfitobacter rhodophyticola TaxID=3238304 RepID=UPI0035134C62